MCGGSIFGHRGMGQMPIGRETKRVQKVGQGLLKLVLEGVVALTVRMCRLNVTNSFVLYSQVVCTCGPANCVIVHCHPGMN